MGATNNSLVKIQDIKKSGGIMTENFSIDENKLLKDIEITTRQQQETGQVHSGPLCYNVTLKNEYGNDHLTKFQDLDIAETYPITLQVTLGLNRPSSTQPLAAQWTGYTLYGFTAKVTYPNSSVKSHSIDITETTADKNIEIKNCCDNAKVKVSVSSFRSGATISTTAKTVNADVAINSLFTEDDGLICTGPNSYSCFTLTQGLTPGGPITPPDPEITVKRKIDIFVKHGGFYKLFIGTATYATGATLSEVQDYNNLTQVVIPELSQEMVGLLSSSAIQATISVPANSFVAIYLADPLASLSSTENMTQYDWVENNVQYVSSGYTRESVTYTITHKN